LIAGVETVIVETEDTIVAIALTGTETEIETENVDMIAVIDLIATDQDQTTEATTEKETVADMMTTVESGTETDTETEVEEMAVTDESVPIHATEIGTESCELSGCYFYSTLKKLTEDFR
jgi:uncharacterized protein (DUF2164 family)